MIKPPLSNSILTMSDPVVRKAVETALEVVKDNFPQAELKDPEKYKEVLEAAETVALEQESISRAHIHQDPS